MNNFVTVEAPASAIDFGDGGGEEPASAIGKATTSATGDGVVSSTVGAVPDVSSTK